MREYTDTKKLKTITGKDPKERLIKARMKGEANEIDATG